MASTFAPIGHPGKEQLNQDECPISLTQVQATGVHEVRGLALDREVIPHNATPIEFPLVTLSLESLFGKKRDRSPLQVHHPDVALVFR